jgi:hypothetical protein
MLAGEGPVNAYVQVCRAILRIIISPPSSPDDVVAGSGVVDAACSMQLPASKVQSEGLANAAPYLLICLGFPNCWARPGYLTPSRATSNTTLPWSACNAYHNARMDFGVLSGGRAASLGWSLRLLPLFSTPPQIVEGLHPSSSVDNHPRLALLT